jgi:hypothetical protein
VPIVLALVIFKRLSAIQRRLLLLVVLVFTTELTANLIWRKNLNNNPIYHIYAVLEFFLILRIFKLELTNLFSKYVFNVLFIMFASFAVINAVVWQSVYMFNSNVTTVSSFLIVVLVLVYFYSLLQKENLEPLGKTPIFWISTGMMLYFSTNLILFFITKNETFVFEYRYTFWSIHAGVNIILFCFYTYALWIRPKTE